MPLPTQSRLERRSRKKTKQPEVTQPPMWPWIVLVLAIVFAVYIRIGLLEIPFERDEGEFAYMGQLMLNGIPPYKIAYNMKMPGIYAIYAVMMAVFGQTIWGVHFGFMLVNLATIVFVFLLTKRILGACAGAGAAAAYSVLSVCPCVLGTQAHATHFVLVFALAGMLLTFRAVDLKRGRLYFAAGVLFGTSFLMKQPGAVFGLLAFAYCAWHERRDRSPWPQAAKRLGLLVVGGIAPLAVTVVWLWQAGVLETFFFWTFTYLRTYATQVSIRYAPGILRDNLPRAVGNCWPLYIPAGIGLLVLFADRNLRRKSVLTIGFFLASFIGVSAGFYYRPHYFVLILPAVAMLAGLAVSWAMNKLSGGATLKGRALLPAALYVLALASCVAKENKFFFAMTPDRACRHMYGANPFPESIVIADYIRKHSSPDDTVAVVGSEPQIYFYTNRKAAVTYIYMYPLMEVHPFARKMQQEMIGQIVTNEPKYVVFVGTATSWCKTPRSDQSLAQWLVGYGNEHYKIVGRVDTLAENWVESYWGDDVVGRPLPDTGHFISLFERKEP